MPRHWLGRDWGIKTGSASLLLDTPTPAPRRGRVWLSWSCPPLSSPLLVTFAKMRFLALLPLLVGGVRPPNVLHLMADDLRPQLGCYKNPFMLTPKLDALASEGMVFENAYTQYAYCAPSRNSFMTGRRPERTKCLNFDTDFRQQHGDAWVALPQFFKDAGYFTSAAGKLYHDGMDDPLSWSYPSNQTTWIQCQGDPVRDVFMNYCAVTASSRLQYTDEELALKEGLRRMQAGAASGQPWWVGIGIHRPHWPSRLPAGWTGPEVYPTGVEPPDFPKGIPLAPFMSGGYKDGDYHNPALGCPNCSAPTGDTLEYRRWYYAAVSYADHMLGQALDMLDTLGERNNTIVLFHSDHGACRQGLLSARAAKGPRLTPSSPPPPCCCKLRLPAGGAQ